MNNIDLTSCLDDLLLTIYTISRKGTIVCTVVQLLSCSDVLCAQEEEQAVPFCNTNAALENYIYLKVISIHSGHDVERDLFENLSQLLLGKLRSSLQDDN